MKVTVVGSGSSGNGYLIESQNEILILELGCHMHDYLEALNYDEGMRKVVGCLVSHRHSDHLSSRTASTLIRMGIDIFGPAETCMVVPTIKGIKLKAINRIGAFKVQAFELEHSAQCYGYLIECPDGCRILFVTDCRDVPLNFKNITFYMVEANNDEDVIVENMMENNTGFSRFDDHLSLQKAERFLFRNFSASVMGILLIHLSATNSDEKMFVDTIKASLGFNDVWAAKKGCKYDINKDPF